MITLGSLDRIFDGMPLLLLVRATERWLLAPLLLSTDAVGLALLQLLGVCGRGFGSHSGPSENNVERTYALNGPFPSSRACSFFMRSRHVLSFASDPKGIALARAD
jgi:hypothetical protein